MKRNEKIKRLLQVWPPHVVMTTQTLRQKGLSYSDIQNYQGSQWIVSVGTGVFKKASETISWEGCVYGLQHHYQDTFFVGGRTALELLGAAHFIPFKQSTIFLFSSRSKLLPLWFRQIDCGVRFDFHKQSILPPQVGITQHDCGEFSIAISCRERAALEMAALKEGADSFKELFLIFENLGSLRPDVLQDLLKSCSSIKAKRIFLFLACRLQHPWFQQLNLSQFDLGKGPREVVKKGLYDPQFKITYPEDLFIDDRLEI